MKTHKKSKKNKEILKLLKNQMNPHEKEKLKSAFTLADLRTSDVGQREIEKQQMWLRTSEAEFAKTLADYNKRYPSDKYEVKQVYEEVPDDQEEEIPDDRKRIKAINRQISELKSRIIKDQIISQNQENGLERRESAKKGIEQNNATLKKSRKKETRFLAEWVQEPS